MSASLQDYTTLNKITTVLATHWKKELDEPFKRMLALRIDYWRSRLIRNSLSDKPEEAKFFMQDLYMTLEKTQTVPDCLPDPTCPVLKTVSKVPTPMRYGSQLFAYVGSIDGENGYTYVDPGTEGYLREGKYSKNITFYSWDNINITVKNRPNLPLIRIRGVFDAPYQVMQLNCDAGQGCDYWNEPYPITGDILQGVVQGIIQIDFGGATPNNLPSDHEVPVNNAKED